MPNVYIHVSSCKFYTTKLKLCVRFRKRKNYCKVYTRSKNSSANFKSANKKRPSVLVQIVTMSDVPNSSGSVLGKAVEVTVHSGNVASWNKLRRKGGLTSTDEVGSWSVYS